MKIRSLHLDSELERQAARHEQEGMTVVFCGWDSEVRGLLVFGDELKETADSAVSRLRGRDLAVRMLSGDSMETTGAIANKLGITEYRGGALPQDKVAVITRLQREGRWVAMVGDGLNDAAALASADVGVALGSGANIIREASDVTLIADDPARVLEVFDLSALTVKTIRQNLFFAFCYNLLGLPLAVSGMLNPVLAVCAMFVSSLTVIGNTLRIARRRHMKTEQRRARG
jgi:Cu+-exporting ATPase